MELTEFKSNWIYILVELEAVNRVAWLTFFDARIVSIVDGILLLDFRDAEKFSGSHSFLDVRIKFAPLLKEIIEKITGENLEIAW